MIINGNWNRGENGTQIRTYKKQVGLSNRFVKNTEIVVGNYEAENEVIRHNTVYPHSLKCFRGDPLHNNITLNTLTLNLWYRIRQKITQKINQETCVTQKGKHQNIRTMNYWSAKVKWRLIIPLNIAPNLLIFLRSFYGIFWLLYIYIWCMCR